MEPLPVPRQKRKHSACLISVSQCTVFTAAGADISTQFNCANPNCTLYKLFEEQFITEGIIKWRLHEQNQDVCIMNDIKPTTGHLKPQSFFHVECTKGANDEDFFIRCTCNIYSLIQRAAHQESHILPGEDVVLDENLTCMHCRFFLNWVTCTDFIGNLEWFDIITNSCLYVCIDTCVRTYVY